MTDEAEALIRARDFTTAEKLLSKAAKAEPGSARVHYLLGVSVHEQGNLDRAIACYRKAAGMDAAIAGLQRDLGAACMEKRRYAEALEAYREALRQDANDELACQGAASALREMGDIIEARKLFQRALWLRIRRWLRLGRAG
jgi:tetratricopeptide (TPR) repeat protein